MSLKNKKFLIVILRFHGDVLLTKPLIDNIKLNFPDSKIDILLYKGTESIFEFNLKVSEIIKISSTSGINQQYYNADAQYFSDFLKIFSTFKLWLKLFFKRYDYGIFLTTQWRVIPMSWAMIGAKKIALADKKRTRKLWKKSFNFFLPELGDNHIVERNLSSLKKLGLKIFNTDLNILDSIPVSEWEKNRKLFRNVDFQDKYCVIHPSSRRNSKLWRQENYIPLVHMLTNKGFKVVLTSGPNQYEVDYVNFIEEGINDEVVNLSGKTTLISLAALISKASLFIGVDSVASHIAAAVDTPSITLFGPSNVSNWRPWSDKAIVISRTNNEEICKDHCNEPGKYKKCLCYISPSRVFNHAEEVYDSA